MKIAYQGEPGAFSEAAARRVEPDAQLIPCRSFEEVFDAVQAGTSALRRPADRELDRRQHPPQLRPAARAHELPIVGEVELPVVHHLLALPGATLDGLRRVYSHPQALAQCERFLRTLTGVEIIATYDTAGSAKMVADAGLTDAAAIASARAGEVFGLDLARRLDPGLRRQHHALPRHRRRAAAEPRRRQDVDRLLAAQRAGVAVQGAERVRAARHRPDEARVAADPGPALGVSVLRRSRRRARRGALHARAGASRRVRADAAHARHVRELEDATRGCSPTRSRWCRDRRRQSADDRREPRAGARDAEGGRLHRRRPQEAAHRRRQHLDRDRSVQLPPARSRRAREGRDPRRRRHADGVQHGLDLRRHHDGHRGDARLARQPRGDRRLDRAGHARQRLRRPRRARRLRQDDSRRR